MTMTRTELKTINSKLIVCILGMPAYPLTQLNLELMISNSLDLGKELALDLIVSWQIPICRVFYMLWSWAPFVKQWNSILSTSFNTCWFRRVLIWTQPRRWQTQSTDQNVSPLLEYWPVHFGAIEGDYHLSFCSKQLWTHKGTGRGCVLGIQLALIARKKLYAETTLNPRACHDHNESSQRKHTCKLTINHHCTKIPPIHMTTWRSNRAVDALVVGMFEDFVIHMKWFVWPQ